MTTIRFVLESIAPSLDSAGYLRRKLAGQLAAAAAQGDVEWEGGDESPQVQAAADSVWANRSAKVPVTPASGFPPLSPAEEKLLSIRKACASGEVTRFSPLLEGEVLLEDQFSYLQEDYGAIPENTAILRRTTTQSVMIYFLTHASVQETTVRLSYPEPVRAPLPQVLAASDTPDWETLIKFGEGLVWLLPEPFNIIGAAILPVIFPGNKTDWQAIFKSLADMIKQDIVHLDIESLDGKVKGVLLDLDSNYRGISKPVNEKQAQLDDYISRVTEVVGTLQEKDFRKPGLAVFVSAASLHLSLLEEKAMLENHQAPQNSQYSQKVKEQAGNYVSYVTDPGSGPYPLVKADLNTQRAAHLVSISEPKSHTDSYCHGGAAASCTSFTYWYFEDPYAKYTSQKYEDYRKDKDHYHSGKDDCQPARDSYYRGIVSSYQAKLDSLEKLMTPVNKHWKQLAASGIPKRP